MEEVPFYEFFNKANITLQVQFRAKKINVHLENDPALSAMMGNREFLRICFDCLIDNAVKYSPSDEVVFVKMYSDDQFTVCDFIDNGPGFFPVALKNLFGLFAVGGSYIGQNRGLNLELIKLIMKAHQGQVEVTSNQPKGATVRLTFPK